MYLCDFQCNIFFNTSFFETNQHEKMKILYKCKRRHEHIFITLAIINTIFTAADGDKKNQERKKQGSGKERGLFIE